jgi:hypothetical protein
MKSKLGGKKRGREYKKVEGQETISPVLKVPKQWPLVLLVEVMHMIDIYFLYDFGRAALWRNFD